MKHNHTPQTPSCTENFSLPKLRIFMLTKGKNLIFILKSDKIMYNYFFGNLTILLYLGFSRPIFNPDPDLILKLNLSQDSGTISKVEFT